MDQYSSPSHDSSYFRFGFNNPNFADTTRNHFIAFLGEFAGTFMFLFFSFIGNQISNTPSVKPGSDPNLVALTFSSLAFGASLAVNVWVFYRVTGGLFNPAVALALCLVGAIGPIRAAVMFVAQIVAGIAAAGVVSALFPGPLACRTTLGGGASISQGLFIEMFLTAQLVVTIIMVAVVKHRSTYLAPIAIGLAMFLAELCGTYFTGGSLNPARSFGPDVVSAKFTGYHWIYWIGPGLGALLATAFFYCLKLLRYQTCNPGQDDDGFEKKKAQMREG
ncbi:hypothetical protein AJ80_06540 [Polytolypa hystricis UAMH7299]|uniref:Aquaporin n=1 Tax=Polytolypa hystricis (strain UAMH7299) TaxID=1447883 RepID=A0A2B7XVG2_POLH7|nr:hypothetical protein AJ80_06540 [Polytolypa hystricis UAMH7299]